MKETNSLISLHARIRNPIKSFSTPIAVFNPTTSLLMAPKSKHVKRNPKERQLAATHEMPATFVKDRVPRPSTDKREQKGISHNKPRGIPQALPHVSQIKSDVTAEAGDGSLAQIEPPSQKLKKAWNDHKNCELHPHKEVSELQSIQVLT